MPKNIIKRFHVCLVTTGNIEQAFGGEEKFTLSFFKWLRSKDFEVTVLYNKLFQVVGIAHNSLNVALQKRKVSVLRNTPIALYQLYLFFFSFLCVLRILNIHKRKRISIIYAQGTKHGGLSAVVAGWIIRVPVVVHSHGHVIESFDSVSRNCKDIKRGYMLCLRATIAITHQIVVEQASALIAVSDAVKDRLVGDIPEKNKVFVIPIGIDAAYFRKAKVNRSLIRRKLQICPDSLVVGFVGRLSPEKNLITLIKAFGMFKKNSKSKLLLVGDGNMRNELKRLTKELRLSDSVIFTGFRNNIPDFLSAIDVFVLPSYVEGCPTALLEAMASGKVVVASSIPSVREIVVDHENGLLFNPAEPSELKKTLFLLSRNPKLREKVMNKGYLTSLQYNKDRLYGKILKLLSKCLEI